MAAVRAAQSKLVAEAGELGPIYDTCSHAWVMIRETAVEELTDSLRDGNKEEKAVALKELIAQVRHSTVKYIREQSAKGLGGVAAHSARVRDAVMELLDDEDAGVREAAVIALRQRLQSKMMIDALKDSQKGIEDAWELEKPMISKIHALIDDVNGRVRFNAIDSLSSLVKMFHTDSIQAVQTRLRDEEGWVRRHAAEMVNVALFQAQGVKKTLPKSSLVFITEGYEVLLAAAQQCYDVGLQVVGGGDVYLRQTAVKGLTAAAEAEAEAEMGEELTAVEEGDISDDEGSFGGGGALGAETRQVKATQGDPMGVLKRCLKDTDPDVRDAAAKALLRIAGTGNRKAVEAVMSDVECVLSHGLGAPGLGVKGTPESCARGQLFGQAGMGTRDQQRRDRLEQEAFNHAMELGEKRRKELELQRDLDELKVLAEHGFISKLREAAFPQEDFMHEVLEAEAIDPDRKKVREAAAEWLFKLSLEDNDKAARAAAVNLSQFCLLTGKADLDARAKRRIAEQHAAEYKAPPPEPDEQLCETLRDALETFVDDDGEVPEEQKVRRRDASKRLAELVEAGDTAAEDAVLDDAKSFLQGLYDAGLLSDKTLKAVMGPAHSY